ncbi:hypothetical protein CHUAL_012409 [Chamberlinius hualienensis]
MTQSAAKSQNYDPKSLTFTKAMKHLLYLHYFFGVNVSNFVKWQTVFDFLFAIHLMMSVMYLALAYAKEDCSSDDIQIVFMSVGFMFVAVCNLLGKLSHRQQCHNKTKLLKEIEQMLKRFNGKETAQLEKLEQMSLKLFLIPTFIVVFHYIYHVEKYILGDYHVDYGTEKFQYLSEKYHIDYIYNLAVAPFNLICDLMVTLFMIPVFSSLKFALDQLISLQPTYRNARKLIKIHRNIRQLYRLTNATFSTNLLLGCLTLLMYILTFARTVTVNWQVISWATVLGLLTLLAVLFAHVIIVSRVNEKLRQSNCHLQRMSYHLSNYNTHNLITAKLDLYVTEVNLDFPYITFGNWINVDSHLVVSVCIIVNQ